ncbi:MAG: N-acetyltransferase [Sphingomonadaceae bacterium]
MEFLPLAPADDPEVDALCDMCFGPARHQRTASILRQGAQRLESASFIVRREGQLIGAVQCHMLLWRRADGLARDMVLLGPLVSHPDWRDCGIGGGLMNRALAAIDAAGLPVMLVGDLSYYGRWGFSAEATGQWQLPGPVDRARLLLRAQHPRSWQAAAHFRDPLTDCRAA